MIEESADLESQEFTIKLLGSHLKTIMEALHFSHGFLGGVDEEVQQQTVDVNDLLVDQIMQQIPKEVIVDDDE